MLVDEVALILKGQNVAGPSVAAVTAELKALRTATLSVTKALGEYNSVLDRTMSMTKGMIGPTQAYRFEVDALTRSVLALRDAQTAAGLASQRMAAGGFENSVAGPVGSPAAQTGAKTAERDAQLAFQSRAAGVTQGGGLRVGPVASGAGLLGGATVPIVAAAVIAYLGTKAVTTANQYNQSIADIVGTTSQNPVNIAPLQAGILAMSGGLNRFTPQQATTGVYPIASSPAFGKSAANTLAALKMVLMQAQPAGAAAIPALSLADVGAANAYGLTSQAGFASVVDIISKGVAVGQAEPIDFAKGVGTFAPAAKVAGLTGAGGLAQAAGAFAQASLNNPKFRFDAQALNSLLLSVTNKQTATAAQTESLLGIGNLFGTGAIGKAGGLPQWLTQLQSATAGPQQQQFLQAIFGRQNALQAIRGLTGENLPNALTTIGMTQNYKGSAAAGAAIADSGPQAQWDQLGSRFNKTVIDLGTTISKTLNPDLVLLGGAAMDAAGKLGDLLGATGSFIDYLSATVNLPKLATESKSWIDQHVPGGAGTFLAAAVPFGLAAAGAKIIYDQVTGGSTTTSGGGTAGNGRSASAILPSGLFGGVTTQAPVQRVMPYNFPGPLLPGEVRASSPAPAIAVAYGLGGNADTLSPVESRIAQQQQAARQAAAAAYLAGERGGNNIKQLTADRGSINYRLSTGASNSALDQSVAQLRADLVQSKSGMTPEAQAQYLQKYSKPVTTIENQRLVDAANMQVSAAQVFSESVKVHHGSIQQQKQAIDRQYQTDMALAQVLYATGAYGPKGSSLAKLGLSDAQLKALDVLQSGKNGLVQTGLGALQDQMTLDKLKNLPTASDIKSISQYMSANATALGLSPTQLQIQLLQLKQQDTIAKQTAVQLIRPRTAGLGGLMDAGFGQSVASLAGMGGADSRLAQLERENAALRQQVAYLQKLVAVSTSSDGKLAIIAAATVKSANSGNAATPTSKNASLRSIVNHH